MENIKFSALHKRKPAAFGNVAVKREEDSNTIKKLRHARRTERFNERRNLGVLDTVSEIEDAKGKTMVDRKKELKEYLAKKEALKKAQQRNKRPPFVVGIPHHGASPVLKEVTNIDLKCKHAELRCKEQMEVRHQRVTRHSTKVGQGLFVKPNKTLPVPKTQQPKVNQRGLQKRSKADIVKQKSPVKVFPFTSKKVFSFRATTVTSTKQLTSPHTPTVLKRSAQKKPILKLTASPHPNRLFHRQVENRTVTRALLKQNATQNKAKSSTDSLAAVLSDDFKSSETQDAHSEMTTVKTEQVRTKTEPENVSLRLKQNTTQNKAKSSIDSLAAVLTENSKSSEAQDAHSEMTTVKTEQVRTKTEPENVCGTLDIQGEEEQTLPAVHEPCTSKKALEAAEQRERLEQESSCLLTMADEWAATALRESLPSDIADEVDSVVGQTRLLTRDKFNQFRGLILAYENSSNLQKITIEDLNGFWDMIYLQVEHLNKKYKALQDLKDNGWIKPQPVFKKKNVLTKPKNNKPINKPSALRELIQSKRKGAPTVLENSGVKTPLSEIRRASSHFSSPRRTRDHSLSPFIAMRLSTAGRSLSRASIQAGSKSTPTIDMTPTSANDKCLEHNSPLGAEQNMVLPSEEVIGQESYSKTPRRSSRLRATTPSPRRTSELSSDEMMGQESLSKTPRRSVRLKAGTPTPRRTCHVCDSPDCFNNCSQSAEEPDAEPKLPKKGFKLRPSILIAPEVGDVFKTNNGRKRLKKNKETIKEEVAEEHFPANGHKSGLRRSKRKSAKVTFDTSNEEKLTMKFPSTPYKNSSTKKTQDTP